MLPKIEFESDPFVFFKTKEYNMTPELIEKLKIVKNQFSKVEMKPNESNLLLEIKGLNCLYYNSYLTGRLGYKMENGIPQINRNSILELLHPDYKEFFEKTEENILKELSSCNSEQMEKFRASFLLRFKEIDGNYNYYMINVRLNCCDADNSLCVIQFNVKRQIPDYRPVDKFFFKYSYKEKDSIESVKDKYKLTSKEQEVILYGWMGYTLKQTAIVLNISSYTVRNHRLNAFNKMGIHDIGSTDSLL